MMPPLTTPPPTTPLTTTSRHRQIGSLTRQNPHSRNSRAVSNSLERRDDMDSLLESDLGDMRFEVPGFCNTYFSRVPGLGAAHKSVFKKCMQGPNPLFGDKGWRGWPQSLNQYLVLEWFSGVVKKLSIFAEEYETTPMGRRVLVAGPDTPLKGGSPADRKLGVGFARDSDHELGKLPDWSQILVPGELKSNPMADAEKSTWHDMGKYIREVFITQDTRRFVLGFTLCGSRFRLWEFDRVGGLSSDGFDINKNGEQFVYIILGFLWISKEGLGFDPTVTEKYGQRLITITRNGQPEQFIIDKLLLRTSCIAGRATTCWKTHRANGPQTDGPQPSFVIKDSWQDTAQEEEEGALLNLATEQGVDNIVRYYHHETVAVRGQADDVHNNIRGGLNIQDARSWLKTTVDKHTGESNTRKMNNSKASSKASNTTSRKRPASQINAPMPPNKRPRSGPQTIHDSTGPSNREHRRVVLCDYGTPIYKASSRAALLKALEGCIHGHRCLRGAGILHRDISINNVIINEDKDSTSPFSFLIDLDLATKEGRDGPSGAKGRIGTRVFMAIGLLDDEQHSYMHDLESFFWVLFWICVHYGAGGQPVENSPLDSWDYKNDDELIDAKRGIIYATHTFERRARKHFTSYYQPLIPCVEALRKEVFPDGALPRDPDPTLYNRMIAVLQEAQKDSKVLGTEVLGTKLLNTEALAGG
ncbi:putative serine threonine-protein kinase [Rosellinia necatrix]|uniref:EKC/KEOPS complex subunit BUD32 n=1 Tax=Rosellinia necatrix TaxID=77044 RepID=A0A1W2TTA7_ROSNE|nr:putative serine threonine-protein kinase [Rosellinia necatrix]